MERSYKFLLTNVRFLYSICIWKYNWNSPWKESIRPFSSALRIWYFSQGNFTNGKHSIIIYILKVFEVHLKNVCQKAIKTRNSSSFCNTSNVPITLLKWISIKTDWHLHITVYNFEILKVFKVFQKPYNPHKKISEILPWISCQLVIISALPLVCYRYITVLLPWMFVTSKREYHLISLNLIKTSFLKLVWFSVN